MIVNGLSPGMPFQEKNPIAEAEQQKRISREALKAEEAQREMKKADPDQYKMDDYNLKELLFLMSSRGNTETVEKLAQLLRKEKEAQSTRK